jgi:hypothetical protein
VNAIPSARHTVRMPCPRPPAAPMTDTCRGSGRDGVSLGGGVMVDR